MAAFKNHIILYFLKGAPETDLSGLWVSHALLSGNICLWISLTLQSMFFRPSLLPWAAASACGAASTFWKVTAMTIPALMLMYGKEASNRKQEIDRQHYTIPNQRPKDKHCGKI